MRQMACVDVPALPLQLLLRQHPDWAEQPVAVVDTDRPQGRVLWVNSRARRSRVLPGMRYAAALSLAAGLHAGEVGRGTIDRAIAFVAERLREFSPGVEPVQDDPGAFWLDASGLDTFKTKTCPVLFRILKLMSISPGRNSAVPSMPNFSRTIFSASLSLITRCLYSVFILGPFISQQGSC